MIKWIVGKITELFKKRHQDAFYIMFEQQWARKGEILNISDTAQVQVVKVYKRTKWRVFWSRWFKMKFYHVKVVPHGRTVTGRIVPGTESIINGK